jgi:hypothetical protein
MAMTVFSQSLTAISTTFRYLGYGIRQHPARPVFAVRRPHMVLARRARVDCVESVERIRRRVSLDELERKMLLRGDVHAHDLEARSAVPHCCATGTAEEIQ